MVFPPSSSLIFTQRYCPLPPGHERGARKNGGTCCCQQENSSPRLFVTTSSLIPTFLLLPVLEEAILCLQMPRSLKGRSNNKQISSCQQPLEQPTSLGRAGLARGKHPRAAAHGAGRCLASSQETRLPSSAWTNTPTLLQVCSLMNPSTGCSQQHRLDWQPWHSPGGAGWS